tara:strand:+ start:679 stop:3369 length:2691 start_codon:yes stop_codon:yes gene_type:complete
MPRSQITLNDFSGGLNTKTSPRDIEINELTKADNVILGYKGLIKSTSDSTTKHASVVLTHTAEGNGAFIFNSEINLDLSGTLTQPVQVVAHPTVNTRAHSTIEFYVRNFGNTGNFTFLNGTQASKQLDNSTDNLLNMAGNLNNSATSITVDDASIFNVGDFITIDSETMEITAIADDNVLTVIRYVKGTSAATHDDDDAILEVDPSINMGGAVGDALQPVYYYVDGILYVSDKLVVDGTNSSSPKSFQYINKDRFDATTISEWISGDAAVSSTTDAIFENIGVAGESLSQPSAAGEFRMTLKQFDSYSSTSNVTSDGSNAVTLNGAVAFNDTTLTVQASSGTANNRLTAGTVFLLGTEALQVESQIGSTQIQVSRNIFNNATDLEHADGTSLKTTSEEAITGGGWTEGEYEFTYSLVDYQDNESLPHIFGSALSSAQIGHGKYFSDVGIQINTSETFRKRDKGIRIYTRKKSTNDKLILFLDIDYERGVRRNLYEEFTSWTHSGDYGDSGSAYSKVENLKIKNPSLDTYESINGYSQEEKSISFGSDGGYKCATVCASRAWVANTRKNDVVFNDRIYYTLPNRYSTFPDTFYLDIGINDGDAFNALHSLGNRLLAFKQKKLYIINVSSSSEAGWYLEGEYDGMGCISQESITKTPYGICWVNNSGVFIFNGQNAPIELTQKLDDKLWYDGQVLSSAQLQPAIGYNNKYKQLLVFQDSGYNNNSAVETEADLWVYDFNTQSWTTSDILFNLFSEGGVTTTQISNFLESFDGVYYFEGLSNGKKNLAVYTGDYGANNIDIRTKDLDFERPGLIKKIFNIIVTARDASANTTLTLSYALDGSTSYTDLTGQAVNSAQYDVKTFTINQDCQSISLKLTSNNKIEINDISIEYRITRRRVT